MTHEDQNHNLDIDPSMILLGIGYLTSILVAVGWMASFAI